ncbi:MAG: hypothetical protein JWQ21_1071 [Herminiimonas sp.]|nr:hypothetical protein [Herminiimonas sp.]
MATADLIHDFWFGPDANDAAVEQRKSGLWWSKNEESDREIRERFESRLEAAADGRLDDWTKSDKGLLALILLTDQFPRGMYRNTPKAFEFDSLAQAWCLDGLEKGMDRTLRPIERTFFYMPLEHSESQELQEHSVQLFTGLSQEAPADQPNLFRGYLRFALHHRSIIARFGRFPHRNAILGRQSTVDETEFLKGPGSSF